MTRSLDADLKFAARLADAAWAAIGVHFRNLDEVHDKGPSPSRPGIDPVTEADRAAERAMRALVAAERPQDGVTGEEYPETASESGWRWYFDPIDGTRAFVAGLPLWTTLIALADPDGVPVIGVIDQPVLGERYLGWPGGARLDTPGGSTPIRVSGCGDLREAVIATTDPFIFSPPEQGAWNHLRSTARITRYGLDAYGYARLAAGTIDLVAESSLKAWDIAALIPVVRGAGGLATDWRGNTPKLRGQIVCASSQGVLDQALLALKRAAE
jgi:histidinol phosphatase-like enzyme (inositol monophosphatase family)